MLVNTSAASTAARAQIWRSDAPRFRALVIGPDYRSGRWCTIVRMKSTNRTDGRERVLLALLAGALGFAAGCAHQGHQEDLRRFGVAAVVVVPDGAEVRRGEGGAIVAHKGGGRYGWAYGVSIIPAGEDHDINEWARTMPYQKEATRFTERAENADGWTLAWTEPDNVGKTMFPLSVYVRSLNLVCTTSAQPYTPEDAAAARKVCASLRAP